jgi:hypothetical protein
MQASDTREGILSWGTQALDLTEMMLEGFVACMLEHDELLRHADMHAVHEAVIHATRITAQAKAVEASSTYTRRQLEFVQRLEGSITQLRQDLEKSEASSHSKTQLLLEAKQEAQELRQVSDLPIGINTVSWAHVHQLELTLRRVYVLRDACTDQPGFARGDEDMHGIP